MHCQSLQLEDGGRAGGRAIVDRQLGLFDHSNAAAGREDGGRNIHMAARRKGATKGGQLARESRSPT